MRKAQTSFDKAPSPDQDNKYNKDNNAALNPFSTLGKVCRTNDKLLNLLKSVDLNQ